MALTVQPLKPEELDDFIKIFWDAFEPLSANMILPMIFPNGPQEDFMERFRHRMLKSTDGDLGSYIVTAKDPVSGDIAGVAKFEVIQHPPRTREDMDKKYEEALQSRQAEPPVANVNEALDRAFFKVIMYSEMETMAGVPYLILNILAIRPDWQRRGVGTSLLKYVLEKADNLGLPVYLDSGVSGKALYERFGFRVVGDMPLDCRDYGGRSDGHHWIMLRPAQSTTRRPH